MPIVAVADDDSVESLRCRLLIMSDRAKHSKQTLPAMMISIALDHIILLQQLFLTPSGCRSLGLGVSHTGSFFLSCSIFHVHQVELQVLHIVLDDVDPRISLSLILLQQPQDTTTTTTITS